jgi:ABC-type multidrug transport system permease subunit
MPRIRKNGVQPRRRWRRFQGLPRTMMIMCASWRFFVGGKIPLLSTVAEIAVRVLFFCALYATVMFTQISFMSLPQGDKCASITCV